MYVTTYTNDPAHQPSEDPVNPDDPGDDPGDDDPQLALVPSKIHLTDSGTGQNALSDEYRKCYLSPYSRFDFYPSDDWNGSKLQWSAYRDAYPGGPQNRPCYHPVSPDTMEFRYWNDGAQVIHVRNQDPVDSSYLQTPNPDGHHEILLTIHYR